MSTQNESRYTNVIPFPAKRIMRRITHEEPSPSEEFKLVLNRLIKSSKSLALSQGFLFGTTFAGSLYLFVEYFLRK